LVKLHRSLTSKPLNTPSLIPSLSTHLLPTLLAMSETFILTFSNLSSYEKHKEEVIASGGTIKNDLGKTLLGFTAVMPPSLVESIRRFRTDNLVDSGICSFEPDSEVKIAAAAQ